MGDKWDQYDVFCVSAPTAFGKTGVARTLINAVQNVSVITPSNLLVEQFRQEFPDTPTLARLDSYRCDTYQQSCAQTRKYKMAFCKGCQCGKDMSTAKYRKGPGIYNYHTYLAHKLFRQVLVVDEAHNLLPVIKDRFALTIWQHDVKYPSTAWKAEQWLKWAEGLSEGKRKGKKMATLISSLKGLKPEYTVSRTKDWFNGKGTKRGEPEERDCLKLLPVDISGGPALFWPKDVSKIILLSATINHKDIAALGLNRKRVLYLNCQSPIPAGNRPIIPVNLTSVNRLNMADASLDIANYINNILLPKHVGEKGLVHATYGMAAILKQHLIDKRFILHDKFNKKQMYKLFRDSDPKEGRVLVACGMYEGIDLPEDAGRWQVIAKIPWPNLGNPAVKYQADNDPEWYTWECLKTVIQAGGRVCRTPTDYGITYILDSSFTRLKDQGNKAGLVPSWFNDAVTDGYRLF